MSKTRCALFLLTTALVSGACDTGVDDRSEQGGEGGTGASSTHSTSSTNSTNQSSGGAGGASTVTSGATVGSSATNSAGSGGTATSGATSTDGAPASGGSGGEGSGGSQANGGSGGSSTSGGGSAAGGTGGHNTSACDDAGLEWKSGRKTNYTSYPDPGSEECVVYNGCEWAGWFAHCDEQQSEAWVASHDIAAMFPDSGYELHDICLRSGERTMIVTVYDTCGDDDCDGCCTENKGDADALIDLESFTNARWGLPDGELEWADLGPTSSNGCE